jgi:type IV pilus modification protein PilV
MNMNIQSVRRRGFSLIEALVALLVVAFGMLALAGMQVNLSRDADIAKQRTEAMRLASDRIERMRSFDGVSTGSLQWNSLDALTNVVVSENTNTTFTVASTMGGVDDDAWRAVSVSVTWVDRTGATQSVNVPTVLARVPPKEAGFVGNPLPLNTQRKRPKNRHINVPIPALDLQTGESSYQFSATYAIVFSNITGNVVRVCNPGVINATIAQILASSCITVNGYIVAGYINNLTGTTWANASSATVEANLGINHSGIARDQPDSSNAITCAFNTAVDQNTNATIAAYKYYICVVPLNSPYLWDGTIRIGGVNASLSANYYIVCRYQYTQTAVTANERNIQPYVDVNMSLDLQNYALARTNAGTPTDSSCPASMTDSAVSIGKLHQNCKSTSSTVGTDCPAKSP